MFENNVFRTTMLIGGILTLGIILTGFFAAPAVEADPTMKMAYERVMGETVGEDTIHDNHLTIYEAILFNVEGRSRSNVRHY